MAARKQTHSKARSTNKSTRTTRTTRTARTTKAPARSNAKKTPLKLPAIRDCWNKSQLLTGIADHTGLTKKQVGEVFEQLENIICQHLKKGGAGEFTLPGLAKFVTKRKPATKARKGINPFTGEEVMFKAKPAKNVVKIRPLKKAKEMVV